MSNTKKISVTTKTLFGFGSVADGVKNTAFNIFLLFYYTQVIGLPGTLAGVAIFIALLLDAFSDPLVGYWSDRLRSAWGRRHPLMYAAALPMGIAFYFLFNPPMEASHTTIFTWMLVWAVLTRLFMTFHTVPSTAMIPEMTKNYDERTSISGLRILMGWFGGIAFATVGYAVYFAPSEEFADGRLDPSAYQNFAFLGAILIVSAILICAAGTHKLIPQLKEVFERSGESEGLKRDFANLLSNKPFLILVAMVFVSATSFGFYDVIGLYMFTYFWGMSTNDLVAITGASLIGSILAFVITPWLSKKFDKRPIALAAVAVVAVCYPAIISLRLLGVLPDNGDPMILNILLLNAVVAVFGVVTLTMLFISMIADTVDRNELLTGRRQEAIYVSAFTLSMKATSGVGVLLAGIALDLVSFPRDVGFADVPQATLDSLGIMVAGAILVFWLFAFIIMWNYPLTREKHARILEEIEARRSDAPAPAET